MIKAFISHSSKDKKFVRTLKEDLNENGIETWFDEDQLDLGDSLLEKLDTSLEESTHFIIILSSHSVNSDWVKLELNKAISQVAKKLMHKIIPIKYRDCIIPSEIINLLYGDLSKEIVQIIDDKVKFTTDGYTPFLNKLIKTLNTPTDKKLTNQDKIELKEEFKQNESIISKNRDSIATLYLQVAAYSDSISLKEFKDKVNKYLPEPDENINPIVLPRVIKNIFTNVKIGEPLTVTFDSKNNHVGHFAGFRRDDIKITVSPDIRHQIEIIKDQRYVVKFDANNKSIDFNEM